MRSLCVALVLLTASTLAAGLESYSWQSLGGAEGSCPSVTLVESDLGHIVVDVEIPGFWMTTWPGGGQNWERIFLPGYYSQSEVGFPEVPSVPVLFALPIGTQAVVTVEDVRYSTFDDIRLLPRQPAEIDMPHAAWPFEMNDRAYGSAVTPGAWALADMEGMWAGLHNQRLVLNPFQFDAATGELRAASSMRVRVEFQGAHQGYCAPINPGMEAAMAGNVINFADFRPYAGNDGSRAGTKYIFICNSGNIAAVAPLYELYNWLGMKAKVVTLPNPATVAQIYAAIADNYETGVTRFALIAGTYSEMPSYNYGSHVGDYYFACLTGGDLQPEIGVGRLTGSSAQIDHQVDKIIDGYLAYPFTDDTNTTGIIPSMSVLAAHEEQYPGKYTQCCNEIAAYPYSLINFTFIKVYPPEGGTAQMVSDAINNGDGFVTYRGHGDVTYWAWSPGWNATNINALTNTFMPPVANIACLCGRYNESGDCLAESWQFATHGSSGNLAAADPSYTEANHTYIKEIYKAIYDQGTWNISEAINDATVITMSQHGTYGEANAKMYFWFGDPAMEIWSFDQAGEFGILDITGPSVLNPGPQTVTLTVTSGGSPVSGATVAFTDGIEGVTDAQTFYQTGTTNASGQVSFSVTIPSSGQVHAGATKHNYKYDTIMWTIGVGIGEGSSGAVPQLSMGIPSPNPVTVSASIEFSTPAAGIVDLGIYDITGRLVETLVSSEMPSGTHSVVWQPGQTANGVYFVRLTTPSGCITRQVMVVR